MATIEQVERLRARANVTYDEAKAALEACGDDLLDAMIYLERQGKVKTESGGAWSSAGPEGAAVAAVIPEESGQQAEGGFGLLLRRFGAFCLKVLRVGNENYLEIYRRGEKRTAMPVTVLVLLLIFAFWITVPLAVVGLFFGFRYRFDGPQLGGRRVNEPMDYVADAAEELKNTIRGGK